MFLTQKNPDLRVYGLLPLWRWYIVRGVLSNWLRAVAHTLAVAHGTLHRKWDLSVISTTLNCGIARHFLATARLSSYNIPAEIIKVIFPFRSSFDGITSALQSSVRLPLCLSVSVSLCVCLCKFDVHCRRRCVLFRSSSLAGRQNSAVN